MLVISISSFDVVESSWKEAGWPDPKNRELQNFRHGVSRRWRGEIPIKVCVCEITECHAKPVFTFYTRPSCTRHLEILHSPLL
jgi:hypothetical protein